MHAANECFPSTGMVLERKEKKGTIIAKVAHNPPRIQQPVGHQATSDLLQARGAWLAVLDEAVNMQRTVDTLFKQLNQNNRQEKTRTVLDWSLEFGTSVNFIHLYTRHCHV